MNSWLESLDESDLQTIAPPLIVFSDDIETAPSLMYREGMAGPIASSEDKEKARIRIERELESRPPKKYWESVKN